MGKDGTVLVVCSECRHRENQFVMPGEPAPNLCLRCADAAHREEVSRERTRKRKREKVGRCGVPSDR